MKDPNSVPWDIYVDERKGAQPHEFLLGCLIVPNTASFSHKLFKCRHHKADKDGHTVESREIHWTDLHRGLISTARNWIDCFFQHRGAKYYLMKWPKTETKEIVILRFLTRFCTARSLTAPYNVVVVLDYDSEHARARIQNNVRELGRVARCYHLDSLKNDCIQCCDLLLGCSAYIRDHADATDCYEGLYNKWQTGERLKNSETKRFIGAYFGRKLLAEGAKRAYDLTRRPERSDELT